VADHSGVGAVDLDGLGVRAGRHEALGLRRDGLVLASDEVPGGDGAGASAFTSSRLPTFAAFARTYANTISRGEAADLYARFVIPGSIGPLRRASWMVQAPGTTAVDSERPPLLLLSGGKDRLCPESATRSWERFGRRRYPDDVTDHHVFPDRGHSLTVDAGWEDIGNFCLDWLTDHNL
jgi:pimeloyl-ACP methyl ester carboxylesterase